MISFLEVNKSFKEDFWKAPKKVLDNLSFEIKPGSICGFLGANGAGKTTSIKSTFGFIKIDSGKIDFHKDLGLKRKEVLGKIGYFPESPYFYPFMTGGEFCFYLGKLQNTPAALIRNQMVSWGKKLNIDYALDKKIRSYSKGMLQRLGFLTSLIHDPQMIVLDEPLSGLDPIGRKEFKEALVTLNKEGKTIFFSSHIVSDVEEICDDLVVIKSGKLFYSGETEELLSSHSRGICSAVIHYPNGDSYEGMTFKNITELSSDLKLVRFEEKEKDTFLNWIVTNKVDLKDLNFERPSLEEVIYTSSGSDL